MCVGSYVGPDVFVRICGWSTSQISRGINSSIKYEFGSIPKKLNYTIVLAVGVLVLDFGTNLWIMTRDNVNLLELKLESKKKQKTRSAINLCDQK